MKVRLKQRAKRYQTLSCRCCDRVMLKEAQLDKQTLKEALEEIMLDCEAV
jgi:hypothetical protein